MQPRSIKLTIKLKSEKPVDAVDHPSKVGGEPSASNDKNSQDQIDQKSTKVLENPSTKNEENASEESQKQLVLYDPSVNVNGASETTPVPDSTDLQPPSLPKQHQRVLPSIGAFTVQCANCFKWRLIPTKEKYEEIREHIMERPFFCETGRDWRPDLSCDDPADIKQDGSRLWAIDKPNIAQPPPGWQRLLKFRGEGSSKFADVYYVAPSGKRLRSMVEIQKYLDEHPEYVEQGVKLSRFSFQIPRPLHDNYVRKRPARPAPTNGTTDHGMSNLPHPSEVEPISWVSPDVDTDLQLSRAGVSTGPGAAQKKKRFNDQNVVEL